VKKRKKMVVVWKKLFEWQQKTQTGRLLLRFRLAFEKELEKCWESTKEKLFVKWNVQRFQRDQKGLEVKTKQKSVEKKENHWWQSNWNEKEEVQEWSCCCSKWWMSEKV
jgi:hypothetical protein